jgi:hypothetical protein
MTQFLALAATLSAIVLGACMETQLVSSWPEQDIAIDARAPEWAGREAYYDEKEGLKIGFFNDARYLYVYLATWHRQDQTQILMNGLTVWIDATGGKKETFGVSYPMKRTMREPGDMPRGALSDGARDNQHIINWLLSDAQKELQVVGSNGEPLFSMPAADSTKIGIAAMVDISNRTLVYELRIPFAAGDSVPFGLNAGPGGTIGVGFEVGTRERRDMRRMGENPPSGMGEQPGATGGFPGGGGAPPGDGMERGGGIPPGGASTESLKLWTKVKLAVGPPTSPQK